MKYLYKIICFYQDGSEFRLSPSVRQSQFVEIFDPIVVRPALLFFPWDPKTQVTHKYFLTVSPGITGV